MSQTNIITWSKDRFLDWSDFQAESNPAVFEDVHSVIKYRCIWTVNSDGTGNEIKFFIDRVGLEVEFHSLLSWVRQSQATPKLLNHEQGRFDLAKSLAPKIAQQIQNTFNNKKFSTRGHNQEQRKQFAREDSSLILFKEVEKWERHLFEKQEEYDRLTDYGNNIEKQQEYDDRFKKLRSVR